MSQQTAVLIGASGLTGHHLLIRLLENPAYSAVKILVRKPMYMKHPKLSVHVVDFADLHQMRNAMQGGNILFSCIGTTLAQVKGNKALYRSIDFDIPVNASKIAKELGFFSMLLVSAVGANPASSNFYLKLKGETDAAVMAQGLPAVHIFKPSLLLGNRKELRIVERITQSVMPVLAILIPKRWSRLKPIKATDVADAMLEAGLNKEEGNFYYEYNEMVSAL